MPTPHYYPALRAKQGELDAINETTPASRSAFTPLVSIVVDDDADDAAVQAEVGKQLPRLSRYVGPLIVDATATDGFNVGAVPVVEDLHDELRHRGGAQRPTVSLDSSPGFRSAVSSIRATDRLGVCFRIRLDDLPAAGPAAIIDLLSDVGVGEAQVDLVLDFQAVVGPVPRLVAAFTGMLAAVPNLNAWRSFVVLAGAFPVNISPVPSGGTVSIQRFDRDLWASLVSGGTLARQPDYGDYTVTHPIILPATARRSSPNVRYCDTGSWQVLKGTLEQRRPTSVSMYQLAADVQASGYARPAGFSWGDDEFIRLAVGTGGPGNGTSWRAWNTSHHIAHVIDRLATTSSP